MYGSPPLFRLLDHCADAVLAVAQGRSLNDVLPEVAAEVRPGVQALSFHVMRHWGSAQAVRGLLASKTPPPKVDSLLVSALALLWPQPAGQTPPYPDHTLVDQAVRAARERTPAAAGFINAVLRRFLRERSTWVEQAQQQPSGAWNHPDWWVQRLRQDWPRGWRAWLDSCNEHPPMTLRVNVRHLSAASYLSHLQQAGLSARLSPEDGPAAIELDKPCPVNKLPGFEAGWVSVQDGSAQRAAPLLLEGLALTSSSRVLDACAAPGGKTCHLLELADMDLLALDADGRRLQRVKQSLARLKLQARTQVADARQTARWWDGQPFDAILLDAPCSASGIVRRHPDARWLRRPADIAALARTQAELLDALWPTLKPGGRLVYATCSVFKDEGERQVQAFVQRQGLPASALDAAGPGHLLPPSGAEGWTPSAPRHLADGFFYARLTKPL